MTFIGVTERNMGEALLTRAEMTQSRCITSPKPIPAWLLFTKSRNLGHTANPTGSSVTFFDWEETPWPSQISVESLLGSFSQLLRWIHDHLGEECSIRQVGMTLKQDRRAYKPQSKTVNWEWGGLIKHPTPMTHHLRQGHSSPNYLYTL